MGIIGKQNEELTKEQKQELVRKRLVQMTNAIYSMMLNTHKQGMATVWENRLGLTPQEVMDALGTDAADLLRLSQLLKTTLSEADESTELVDTPQELTVNADGTVTVNE